MLQCALFATKNFTTNTSMGIIEKYEWGYTEAVRA